MNLPIRLTAFVVCASAGFFSARAFYSPATVPAAPSSAARDAVAEGAQLPPMTAAESPLIAEWEQLRAQYGTAPADLPALYSAVKDIKDSFRRRAFRSALIAEWAKTDPAAALAYLREKDNWNAGQLAREWMRNDPQGAVSGLLAGGEKSRETLRSLLSEIAKSAPNRLVEVVTALPKSESRWDHSAQDAFAILAKNDPEAARSAALALTGPFRAQALAGVAKTWSEKDGPAALAWAQGLPTGEGRDAALKAALTGWAKTDPKAALDKIDLVPPGGEEMYYASDVGAQVLAEAAKKDWEGTLLWLREHPGKLGRSSLSGLDSVVSRMLRVDTAGTLRSLAKGGLPGLDNILANSLLNDGYAQRDAVWTWLENQPSNEFNRSIRSSLINAIAWKEPETALTFLEKIADMPDNKDLMQRGVGSLMNGGSRVYLIEGLLEKASPKMRPYLIEGAIMYNYNQGELPGGMEKWVARARELPADRLNDVYPSLARSWASSDPEAALKWATSLEDPKQRSTVVGSAVGMWASSDIFGAADWVNKMPAGPERDSGAHTMALAVYQSHPEQSWEWAQSIQDPERRMQASQMAFSALLKKDSALADQMLQTSNLRPEEIENLRATAAKRKAGGPTFATPR
jgi:hypothetical protein